MNYGLVGGHPPRANGRCSCCQGVEKLQKVTLISWNHAVSVRSSTGPFMPTTSSVKIERHSERECGLLEILYKMAVYRRETYMLFAYLSGQ